MWFYNVETYFEQTSPTIIKCVVACCTSLHHLPVLLVDKFSYLLRDAHHFYRSDHSDPPCIVAESEPNIPAIRVDTLRVIISTKRLGSDLRSF